MPDATPIADPPKRRWYQYSLRMLLILASVTLVAGTFCIGVWWTRAGRVDRIIDQIKAAKTPAEELAAFQALDGRNHIELSFRPFDRQGRVVDMSSDKWWESVVKMQMSLNAKVFDHVVIDPKNISILMHE